MDLFISVIFVHRKNILYILMGIKLPSLPVSILYSHVSILWSLFVFSLWLLVILCYWIENHQSYFVKLLCCHLSFLSILTCVMNCSEFFSVAISWHPSTLASVNSLEMISSTTPSTALVIGQPSVVLVGVTTVSTVFVSLFCLILCCLGYYSFVHVFLMESNSFLSFVASNITFWGLCTSTIQVQHNTCSLGLSFVFLIALGSCII